MIENAKTPICGVPTPSSIFDLASHRKCNSMSNLLTHPDLYSISEGFGTENTEYEFE